MFLFVISGLWVFVLEDEVDLGYRLAICCIRDRKRVDLVRGTALVGTKHDDIRRGVGKFLRV